MKKSTRHDSSPAPAAQSERHGRRNRKKDGRWEFTSSGSLFSLGAVDAVRRVAYRTAGGEMRFLPV